MPGGGGSSSTTVQQKADPWSGVQPSLTQLYSSALNNFNGSGPQYYPGSTIAPQSDVTQQAQQQLYGMGSQQDPMLAAANNQNYATTSGDYLYSNPAMQDSYNLAGRDFNSSNPSSQQLYNTASGNMLNSNPYLDSMFNSASQAVGQQFSQNVMPGIASMFSAGGRYGSNQMATGLDQAQNQYGNTLNNLASQIYGTNYSNERNLQQQAQTQLGNFGLQGQQLQQNSLNSVGNMYSNARQQQLSSMGAAPGLDQANYYGTSQLTGLGAQQDAYNQSLIGADQARYNYGQQAPNVQLQQLSSILNGYPTGATQTTTPPSNTLASLLGGLNTAGGIYNNLSGLFGSGGGALGLDAAGNSIAGLGSLSLFDNPFALAAL